MPTANLRHVNWLAVFLYAIYVWVVGLAIAFFGSVLGFAQFRLFVPLLMILVAVAVVWASTRLALQQSSQPILHGLLIGCVVGTIGLVLALFATGLGLVDLLGFLLQVLGGFLGGRLAQRARQGDLR